MKRRRRVPKEETSAGFGKRIRKRENGSKNGTGSGLLCEIKYERVLHDFILTVSWGKETVSNEEEHNV